MPEIKPKSISQHKLRRYSELEEAAREFELLKKDVKDMLRDNIPCQPGRFVVKLKVSKGSRRPAWKDHGIELAEECGRDGDKWAKDIIENTTPGAGSESIEFFDRENPLG